jgi:hypothetical protein
MMQTRRLVHGHVHAEDAPCSKGRGQLTPVPLGSTAAGGVDQYPEDSVVPCDRSSTSLVVGSTEDLRMGRGIPVLRVICVIAADASPEVIQRCPGKRATRTRTASINALEVARRSPCVAASRNWATAPISGARLRSGLDTNSNSRLSCGSDRSDSRGGATTE